MSRLDYFPAKRRDRTRPVFEVALRKNARNLSTASLPHIRTRAHVDTAHMHNNFSTEQSQTAKPVSKMCERDAEHMAYVLVNHGLFKKYKTFSVLICIGYHMSGEVISVLSLEGRYYNCHERARDNYDIVTRVTQLISPSQSCDNLFITYNCAFIRP